MLNITTSQATTNTKTGPVNGVRQASHLATRKFGLRASRHENTGSPSLTRETVGSL